MEKSHKGLPPGVPPIIHSNCGAVAHQHHAWTVAYLTIVLCMLAFRSIKIKIEPDDANRKRQSSHADANVQNKK